MLKYCKECECSHPLFLEVQSVKADLINNSTLGTLLKGEEVTDRSINNANILELSYRLRKQNYRMNVQPYGCTNHLLLIPHANPTPLTNLATLAPPKHLHYPSLGVRVGIPHQDSQSLTTVIVKILNDIPELKVKNTDFLIFGKENL